MNKITFDEMLRANDLPPIGTIVTTPSGSKMEVVGYAYEADCQRVVIGFEDGYYSWYFDQIRLCTWEGRE